MVLDALQRHLQDFYELSVSHQVLDFLITDAKLAQALSPDADAQGQERLLVHQADDGIDVSLYIDPALLNRLQSGDPFHHLHNDNLNDFLIALEGVSHFLYLIWNAGRDKHVTPMELELQAEIDKYITATTLLRAQRNRECTLNVHERLFANPRFPETLAAAEQSRYRDANQFAASYCRQLECRYQIDVADRDFVTELRRFYRLPRNAKLRRIEHRAW